MAAVSPDTTPQTGSLWAQGREAAVSEGEGDASSRSRMLGQEFVGVPVVGGTLSLLAVNRLAGSPRQECEIRDEARGEEHRVDDGRSGAVASHCPG